MMDDEQVRGLLNALVYDIEFVGNLGPEMAARCAGAILTPGGYFSRHSPAEFMAAIDVALSAGVLPSSDMYSRRFTDEQIVVFLRLVHTELRDRRPGGGRDIGSRLSME